MKKWVSFALMTALLFLLAVGCAMAPEGDRVEIALSDSLITVDGEAASRQPDGAVYVANDIIYYEDGHDFTYGEGAQADAHSTQEAAAHQVVHIAKPGTYVLSGSLSKGQIAVDLGKSAVDDPSAVVTLVLNGVDITCDVAPGVIFYQVYECGGREVVNPGANVDTDNAGANVILADGTENTIRGAYVARIYKPETVELNEEGTEVKDAKKLHKYDGAFYSKMSMNIYGEKAGTGVLNIFAANEGLDTEMHLTINGGNIRILSGNDGINTNEDGISVTTVNGGSLDIRVDGSTGEGDGIDSNGHLVINGGSVRAQACGFSMDSGIDSDMGIYISGGHLAATGNMLDEIHEAEQTFAVFQFSGGAPTGEYFLKNEKGDTVASCAVENAFTSLVFSAPELKKGEYTLWLGEEQLMGAAGQMGMGFPGGMGGMPEGMEFPEGMEDMMPQMPQGGEMPQMPQGGPPRGERPQGSMNFGGENFGGALSNVFEMEKGANYFTVIPGK